jgi:cyclic beta-1,2-glucan synthetase
MRAAAPDRAAHLALLRDLRHAGRPHAAAGQLPGRPEAGDRAPHLAHQHRPVPAAAVAARDFGWAGTLETVERIEARLRHLRKLPRFKGHFYNWYGTLDLQPLAPAYVSSVDSGNLAGHLIVLANACEEWWTRPLRRCARRLWPTHGAGARSDGRVPRGERRGRPAPRRILDEIDALMAGAPAHARRARAAGRQGGPRRARCCPAAEGDAHPTCCTGRSACGRSARARARPRRRRRRRRDPGGLAAISREAREMALRDGLRVSGRPAAQAAVDRLFARDNRHDTSCYDLLASKRASRACSPSQGRCADASLVPARPHGHAAVRRTALVSWSGSMFEYLMRRS